MYGGEILAFSKVMVRKSMKIKHNKIKTIFIVT